MRKLSSWLVLGLLAAGGLAGAELLLRARHRRAAFAAAPAGLRPETAGLEPGELAGHLRVVALGDSITHGMELSAAQAYPALLAERLRARLPGRPVTVINAGICGQTAVQGLARLEHDVLRFRPALTLIAFGLNDASPSRSEQDAAREAELLPAGVAAWPTRLHVYRTLRARGRRLAVRLQALNRGCYPSQRRRGRRGCFIRLLCVLCASAVSSGLLSGAARVGAAGVPRTSPQAFRAALTGMVRRIRRESGSEVVLLTTHLALPVYNAIIRQVAGETGAGLADVELAFAGRDLAGLLEWDGVHLIAAGQRVLAEAVFRNLAKVPKPSQGCGKVVEVTER